MGSDMYALVSEASYANVARITRYCRAQRGVNYFWSGRQYFDLGKAFLRVVVHPSSHH
jgi:hypothetical protein